jgi:hypothetical protein
MYIIFGLIVMVAGAAFLGVTTEAVNQAAVGADPQAKQAAAQAGGIMAAVIGALSVCLMLIGAPMILAGFGVVLRKGWGRILALVLGLIFGLLGVLGSLGGTSNGVINLLSSLLLVVYGVVSWVVLLSSSGAAEFRPIEADRY